MSAVALGGGVLTLAIGIPDAPCTGISATTHNIVIIADANGFNDSINHQGQTWPIINTVRCDIVKITIVNRDTQTHGLAVDYYGSKGTEIPGQQSIAFPTFQVTRAGHFSIKCVIRCTVHYLMINGILNVS